MSLEEDMIQYFSVMLAIDRSKINRDSRFAEDLAMDSLDIVEITMEIEERYKLKIPESDFEKMRRLGDMIDYVKVRSENSAL